MKEPEGEGTRVWAKGWAEAPKLPVIRIHNASKPTVGSLVNQGKNGVSKSVVAETRWGYFRTHLIPSFNFETRSKYGCVV